MFMYLTILHTDFTARLAKLGCSGQELDCQLCPPQPSLWASTSEIANIHKTAPLIAETSLEEGVVFVGWEMPCGPGLVSCIPHSLPQ